MFKADIRIAVSLFAAVTFISADFISVHAQVEKATVKIDGLSCPLCAHGLDKKLKKVEGVEKLEVMVDEGTAKITVKKGSSLSIEEVEKAVKDGGFTSGDISITVTGRLVERDGRTVLAMPGSEEIFLMEQNEQLQKLEKTLNGKDKRVKLTGKVAREHKEGHSVHPYVLSVEQFKIL